MKLPALELTRNVADGLFQIQVLEEELSEQAD